MGGMNCTMGLAYGITSIGYMGSQAGSLIYKAIAFILSKIFNKKNITGPLGFFSKTLLGTNVLQSPRPMSALQQNSFEIMKSISK